MHIYIYIYILYYYIYLILYIDIDTSYIKSHGQFEGAHPICLAQGLKVPLFSQGPLCCLPDMAAAIISLCLGVALVVLGLCIGTGGMQLIRLSELKLKDDHVVQSRVLFVVGLILNMALGPLFDVCGYAFAPAALIAPFTGVNIVLNAVVAPFTLGEKLTQQRLLSSVIVSLAATLSILFKNSHEETWNLERAQQIFLQWRVGIYSCVYVLFFVVNNRLRRWSPKGSVLRGFSLGITAGSLAGNMWCTRVAAVFFAQCAGSGFQSCTPWTTSLIPYAMTAGAAFFALANVPYLAKGMSKYEAIFMVTVFQGSNILWNSLSALVVLQEMDGAPWWKLVGYLSCILGMMFGLTMLLRGETSSNDDLDEDLRMVSLEEGTNDRSSSSHSSEWPNIMEIIRMPKGPADNEDSDSDILWLGWTGVILCCNDWHWKLGAALPMGIPENHHMTILTYPKKKPGDKTWAELSSWCSFPRSLSTMQLGGLRSAFL